ncbi:MAG TPA: glycosyltransferase family 2 protein [Cytophaga sp.]|nr:glycosyltransferase family 2 protein [Cytophaga sp.]
MVKNLISIIIPVKNRASLIGYTLNSIFAQTYKSFEIILVNDASTDNLEEALKPFMEHILLVQNEGKGPGAARNTGLKYAGGDFIKFFDSDDLMSENTLDIQLQVLLSSGKSYITSPYIYATERNQIWYSEPEIILNYYPMVTTKPLSHWMILGLFIPIPSMLFQKVFLEKTGFWPEDIITSEDWLYLWRIAQLEEFPAHTDQTVFIYRLHGDQSTGNHLDTLTRDQEKFRILRTIDKTLFGNEKYSWLDRKMFRMKYYQMATVTKDDSFRNELIQAAGKGSSVLWFYYKIKMKLGRIKTKTDWQPMHGVSNQKTIVQKYLNYFNL